MIATNEAIMLRVIVASGNRALRATLQNVLNKNTWLKTCPNNLAVVQILCSQEPILQLQMLSTELAYTLRSTISVFEPLWLTGEEIGSVG